MNSIYNHAPLPNRIHYGENKMSVYKASNGTWYVKLRSHDLDGRYVDTTKRSFATKHAAKTWEAEKLRLLNGAIGLDLKTFIEEIYLTEMKNRLRPSTLLMKKSILEKHVIPYLGDIPIIKLTAREIMHWQNEIMNYRNPETGKPYTQSYLRAINMQLTSVLSHASRYYNLPENPASKAGNMGNNKHPVVDFWTFDEVFRVLNELKDDPLHHLAISFLYGTGCRCGEMLSARWASIDTSTLIWTVDSTYQVLEGKGYTGPPKTSAGYRKVLLPQYLMKELTEFKRIVFRKSPDDRIFASVTVCFASLYINILS